MNRLFTRVCKAFAVLFCAASIATPSMAAEYKQEYKLSVVPGPTSGWAQGAFYFADLVRERTNGRVNVKVYPAGQLFAGKQTNEFMMLRQGAIDFAFGSTINWSPQIKELNLPCLPFFIGVQPQPYKAMDAILAGKAGKMMIDAVEKKGVHVIGWAENGFRELTNSVREVKSVDDMKNLKIRVAGSNLLMECYKRWGADATNLNWSETYTALQQNTVEGQENPLPAIDAASVQEVQPYCSMWDAIYDCLFFCINQDLYDTLTPEQQAVVDECGQKAVEYERYINRSGDEEIMNRWQSKNGVTITKKEDMDIDSFKKAVEGVDEWFVEQLKDAGYDDGQELVDLFEK